MAAGDVILYCMGINAGGGDLTKGIRADYTPAPGPKHIDQGDAAAPGPLEIARSPKAGLTVTLYGTNVNELIALLSAASANCILAYKGEGGANEQVTLKNAVFTDFGGAVTIRDPQGGGNLDAYSVSGECEWGPTDTWATMQTHGSAI